ncbi:MAG: heavy-metal-associated domain-containing protein, partial [Candidatus Nanohaloarchaea archaeon]
MTDDEVHIDTTDIEVELDLTAIGIGLVGALVATASTLLPNLAYLGRAGVLLAQNQLLLQVTGVALLLGAAAVQAKRTCGEWSLHSRVLKASTGDSTGSQQLQGENLKVANLNVDGMVCQGCQASINGFLQKQPGVKSTAIKLAKSGGPVVFDPSKTSA